MTVNPSNTRELSIKKLIRLAIQVANMMPAGGAESGVQWEKLSGQAKDFLEVAVKNLPTEGVLARSVDFYEVPIVAGTATYEMPDGTAEIVGNAMFQPEDAGENDAQTQLSPCDRSEYFAISTKSTQGTPTKFYPDKHSPIKLYLWPVPDRGGTITVQRSRYLADCDNGTYTPDLEPWWYSYLILEVGAWIALSNGQPNTLSGMLFSKAEKKLEKSKFQASEKGPAQVYSSHQTPWSD